MKGLLIVAHGSRKNFANQEVVDLAGRIVNISSGVFDKVGCAFVQFGVPSFESRIEEFVDAGVDHIIVFPYFLGSGSHVTTDIPRLVAAAAERHPGVRLVVTPHMGVVEGLEELILGKVKTFI
jgi:sirohydrochlorin cobaltochelatase